MKAWVLKKEGGLELKDFPVPPVGKNDVLVKITHSSVCGTDYQIVHLDAWSRENGVQPGIIVGHEGAGVIEKVGENVKDFKEGDFVSLESHYQENPSAKTFDEFPGEGVIGVFGEIGADGKRVLPRGGTYAEYCCVPRSSVFKLSDKIKSSIHPSLLEPAGNGWKVAKYVESKSDLGTIAVFGGGLHGTNIALFLKSLGAENVFLIDPDETRREFAKKFGVADKILSPDSEELKINSFDAVIDAAGPPQVFEQGTKLLKENGLMVLFGLPKVSGQNVDGQSYNDIIFGNKELTTNVNGKKIFIGGVAGRSYKGWQELLQKLEESELLRKKISETLTEIIPIEELGNRIMNVGPETIKLGLMGFQEKN
jgi:threonine 3-dehydrogenase